MQQDGDVFPFLGCHFATYLSDVSFVIVFKSGNSHGNFDVKIAQPLNIKYRKSSVSSSVLYLVHGPVLYKNIILKLYIT